MLSFKPTKEGEFYGYVALEGEEQLGRCLFKIEGMYVDLLKIQAKDELVAEGLVRSALNFSANRSCYIARCPEGQADKVLESLGFINLSGIYSAEIPEALKGSCCK
ncbi:MAG: hypothetical protein K5756_03660 [Clostridiales bacterium]|nr:hypothetical protein [Clostridiales bacterium]